MNSKTAKLIKKFIVRGNTDLLQVIEPTEEEMEDNGRMAEINEQNLANATKLKSILKKAMKKYNAMSNKERKEFKEMIR